MKLEEYEEAIRRTMLYGSSFLEVKVVDPYKQPWYRRALGWLRGWWRYPFTRT